MLVTGLWLWIGAWNEFADARAVERNGTTARGAVVEARGGSTRLSRGTHARVRLDGGRTVDVPVRSRVMPGAAVEVRVSTSRPNAARMHDYPRNHAAWFVLVGAVPMVLGVTIVVGVARIALQIRTPRGIHDDEAHLQ